MSKRSTTSKPVEITYDAAKDYESIQRYLARRTTGRLESIRREFDEIMQSQGVTAAMRYAGSEVVRAEEIVRLSADAITLLNMHTHEQIHDVVAALTGLRDELERKMLDRNPFDSSAYGMDAALMREQHNAMHKYRELLLDVLSQCKDLRSMTSPSR